MKAICLYDAYDLRLDKLSEPSEPGAGEVLIRVGSIGVCGSDLHTYQDGHIGDTQLSSPIVLGHEFSGIVTAVGADARDGENEALAIGQRVAVEPALPCWRCDKCEHGHPNLCRNLAFMGLSPDHGAMREYMIVPARNCFPLPDSLSLEEGALLEPLGVALHAVDLGKIHLENRVVVQGCGLIGLMIMQLAKLSGANPLIAVDQFPWRLDAAKKSGADAVINFKEQNAIDEVKKLTHGHGAEVVFEAAWADESIAEAIEIADLGATVVLVGIPSADKVIFKHSTARRKGLTIKMVRRMKHTYPRAIQLATSGKLRFSELISHRFDLEDAPEALRMNSAYEDNVLKVVVNLKI